MQYNFFYDETEHSRKINYQTVIANNYYDNFISVIVGWLSEEEQRITDKYLAFESKYDFRKVDGELKSQTMKLKDFRLGFASLNKHTIDFYDDLIYPFSIPPGKASVSMHAMLFLPAACLLPPLESPPASLHAPS